jgi:hypothetical protein
VAKFDEGNPINATPTSIKHKQELTTMKPITTPCELVDHHFGKLVGSKPRRNVHPSFLLRLGGS